jgi:hypothetical protein
MFKPNVELVFDKNGILRECYALHEDETRAAKLYVMDSTEKINISEPSVTELRLHSFRVKRTTLVN